MAFRAHSRATEAGRGALPPPGCPRTLGRGAVETMTRPPPAPTPSATRAGKGGIFYALPTRPTLARPAGARRKIEIAFLPGNSTTPHPGPMSKNLCFGELALGGGGRCGDQSEPSACIVSNMVVVNKVKGKCTYSVRFAYWLHIATPPPGEFLALSLPGP